MRRGGEGEVDVRRGRFVKVGGEGEEVEVEERDGGEG